MDGGRGMGGFEVLVRLAIAIALAASVAGCSGKSEASGDEDDGGGTGGTGAGGTGAGGTGAGGTGAGGTGAGGTSGTTGGAAGTSGSAGTGGTPQPSKLGLYLMLRNPDVATGEVAGKQCPAATGIEWDIGAAILSNGMVIDVDSPTPVDFGTSLADGEEDTEISCTVTPSGMVNAEGGGRDPMMTPPNGVVNFALTATASLRGGVNVTGFSVYTPVTLSLQTAAGYPPCTMADVHEVTPGALWGDLDCPALIDPGRPDVACRANGTIVIEYCATQ